MDTSTSSTIILNTEFPKGCILSPVLFTLYTHECIATHGSKTSTKFANDKTIVGMIRNNNEAVYREEVQTLSGGAMTTT